MPWKLNRGRETPDQFDMIERHAANNRRLRNGGPGPVDEILAEKRRNRVRRKPKDAI